jgi:hypothetical protein
VEAFSFYYYDVAVYRQPALSRYSSSTLALYRRGGSDLNKLYLVVRALVSKISMILVREGRGGLSIVNYQVLVTIMLLGRFPLRCN